jgi:hypothetical protein
MQNPSTKRGTSGSSSSAFRMVANCLASAPAPDPSISKVEMEGQELSGTLQG